MDGHPCSIRTEPIDKEHGQELSMPWRLRPSQPKDVGCIPSSMIVVHESHKDVPKVCLMAFFSGKILRSD